MDKTPEECLDVDLQKEVPVEMNFYRIEALRAASRVVAGIYASDGAETTLDAATGQPVGAVASTLALAEKFAKWLETGER